MSKQNQLSSEVSYRIPGLSLTYASRQQLAGVMRYLIAATHISPVTEVPPKNFLYDL